MQTGCFLSGLGWILSNSLGFVGVLSLSPTLCAGIEVHKLVCPESMLLLQENFIQVFENTKEKLAEFLAAPA